MKTGFNLLLWTTHVGEGHFPLLERLKAAGYDGVEVPLFEGDLRHFEKVARALRDDPALPTCCIVARSCYGQQSDRDRSREAGIDHHPVKPVDFPDLMKLPG